MLVYVLLITFIIHTLTYATIDDSVILSQSPTPYVRSERHGVASVTLTTRLGVSITGPARHRVAPVTRPDVTSITRAARKRMTTIHRPNGVAPVTRHRVASVTRPPRHGDIRLVGSSTPRVGTVLVYHAGRWGSVCRRGWGRRDATVVCRQLGYPGTLGAVRDGRYGTGSNHVWLSRVQCNGTEKRLARCKHGPWGRNHCRVMAGVKCRKKRRGHSKTTTSISNTDSVTPSVHTLVTTSISPTVSENESGINTDNNDVIKMSLSQTNETHFDENSNSPNRNSTGLKNRKETEGLSKMVTFIYPSISNVDSVPSAVMHTEAMSSSSPTVTGNFIHDRNIPSNMNRQVIETKQLAISSCNPQIKSFITDVLTHTEQILNTNNKEPASTTENVTTRHVGYHHRSIYDHVSNSMSLSVPVDHRSIYDTISSSMSFNVPEALHTNHYNWTSLSTVQTVKSTALDAFRDDYENTSVITKVHNFDNESYQYQEGFYATDNNPSSNSTASTPPSSRSVSVTITPTPTVGGAPPSSGNVSVTITPTPTVGGAPPSSRNVSVTITPTPTVGGAPPSSRNVSVTITPTPTVGGAEPFQEVVQNSQSDGDDMSESVTITGIRIARGRLPSEGMVQVMVTSRVGWGGVCGDTWGLREALVVCRQLGHGYAGQASQVDFYGGATMVKHLFSVSCSGHEVTVSECGVVAIGHGAVCSQRSKVAGLVCTHMLPDLVPNVTHIERSAYLVDKQLYYLQCAMEENCLSTSAYEMRKTNKWMHSVRRLLRFSSIIHNRGTAVFKPHLSKQAWEWHSCHRHYHSMDVFAHYDVIDHLGNRVAEGHKSSFCLEDSRCDSGARPVYRCVGLADQGISPNCSDDYLSGVDCQWVDITDVPTGAYTLRIVINPSHKVAELRYDNNAVECNIEITSWKLIARNCTLGE